MNVYLKVDGLDEVKLQFESLPAKLRKQIVLNSLRKAAVIVRDAARTKVPVINPFADAVLRGVRKPGTVKRAISVRVSKRDRRAGDVGIFINVRPAKKGQRGNKSPTDPFYWRWINFGWNPAANATGGRSRAGRRQRSALVAQGQRAVSGARFLEEGVKQLPQVATRFGREVGPQIQRLNVKRGLST